MVKHLRLVLVLVALVALGGVLLARPLLPGDLGASPRPAPAYEGAVGRVVELAATDDATIAPECRTLFLSHGRATGRVVVLLHGLTNCPAQFDSLARLLFDGGANVLVPRLPRHGLADRMTGELSRTDARELRDFTDRVIDAAEGLGNEVVVVGLSVGGTMAAWAGQNRPGVDRAILIAPLLAPPGLSPPLARAATRLAVTLPNHFVWWDKERRQDLPGPRHVYPRFATRAAAASLVLGAAVLDQASRAAPGCRSAALVTIEHDPAVGNAAIAALGRSWHERGGRAVTAVEFPESLRLNHDVVDPDQVGARTDLTYPVLLDLIGR
ncbi:MAG: alpha/beta fold hydrolase [Candidatus Eisenbacteria bacterium]